MKPSFRKRNAGPAADPLFEFYNRRRQDRILARIGVSSPKPNTAKQRDPDADLVKERDPIS